MTLSTYQIISIAEARLTDDISLFEKWYELTAEDEVLVQQAMEELQA